MNIPMIFSVKKAVAIFAGLSIVFAALVIAANSTGDPLAQSLLISLGSAIFASGLTFFLIRLNQLDGSKGK